MLLKDFNKAYDYIMMQSDKTNREYWILTEWKTSIDKFELKNCKSCLYERRPDDIKPCLSCLVVKKDIAIFSNWKQKIDYSKYKEI